MMDKAPTPPTSKLQIGHLRRQSEFKLLYARGKRHRTALLTAVVLRPEDPTTGVRAAYVVSKKVAKQAVRRNLIRRRLREALRLLLPADTAPWDLVLIAHREAVEADYWQLHAALHGILRRMGIEPAQEPRKSQQEG